MIKESERLTRLINDVLDLAKIDSGSAEWHARALDLKQVVIDSLNATSQLLQDKGIDLTLELPQQPAPIVADHDRLMQVMLNLLSNAVKFCDPVHGKIRVSLTALGDTWQVAVHDNGHGVREEDRQLIFDRFRQGGDTLTGKPKGTGLGLPISREIIHHFGGRLWVQSESPSEPGAGATFAFTLPLAATSETQHVA